MTSLPTTNNNSETQSQPKTESKEIETEIDPKQSVKKVNPTELYQQAHDLWKKEDYEGAIPILSDAVEFFNERDPNEQSFEIARFFVLYGECLLRASQQKNQIFANPVPPQQQQQQQGKKEEVEEKKEEKQQEKVKVSNGKEEMDEDEEEEEEEEEDLDYEELCWEYLEYARLIIQDYLSENTNNNNKVVPVDKDAISEEEKLKLLEKVYFLEGECLLEQSLCEQAYEAFRMSLELLDKMKAHPRKISSGHFWASVAAEYLGDMEKVERHRGECEMSLVDGLRNLVNSNSNSEVISDEDDLETILEKVEVFLKENESNKELCDKVLDLNNALSDVVDRFDEGMDQKNEEELMEGFDVNKLVEILRQPNGYQAFLESNIGEEKNNESENDNDNENKVDDKASGVTTIGFGNSNNNEEEVVNEIGSMNIRRGGAKKRSLKEAGIDPLENAPNPKRIKPNPN